MKQSSDKSRITISTPMIPKPSSSIIVRRRNSCTSQAVVDLHIQLVTCYRHHGWEVTYKKIFVAIGYFFDFFDFVGLR